VTDDKKPEIRYIAFGRLTVDSFTNDEARAVAYVALRPKSATSR